MQTNQTTDNTATNNPEHARRERLRNHLFQAGIAAALQHATTVGPLPEPYVQDLTEHLQLTESGLLVGLAGALVLRGVSPAECALYAVTGEGDLPFLGCERQLFDTVVTAIADHPEASAPERLLGVLTSAFERLLYTVELHSGIPRATMIDLLRPEPGNE